jgi:hypothetical protein
MVYGKHDGKNLVTIPFKYYLICFTLIQRAHILKTCSRQMCCLPLPSQVFVMMCYVDYVAIQDFLKKLAIRQVIFVIVGEWKVSIKVFSK